MTEQINKQYLNSPKKLINIMSTIKSLKTEIDSLKRKNKNLEKRLYNIEEHLDISPKKEKKVSKTKEKKINFEADLGLKWFGRIGILALVIGIGYFIKYALDVGWITHLSQIIIASIFGIILIFAGNFISKKEKYKIWAQTLMGGGLAIVYFAIFSAYHFETYRKSIGISQTLDIILLTVIILFAIFLSLKKNSKAIFAGAFFLGFVTSLLSTTFESLTLIYCLILTLGLITVVSIKQWKEFGIAGVAATYITFFIWYVKHSIGGVMASFSMISIFLITYFLAYNIQALLIGKNKEDYSNIVMTILNSVFFFIFFMIEILRNYKSYDWFFTLILAIVSLGLYFIAKKMKKENTSLTNLCLSIVYLTITIPLCFNDKWITIFWSVEFILLTFFGFRKENYSLKMMSYFVAGITIFKVFFIDANSLNDTGIILSFLSLIAAFYLVSIYLDKKGEKTISEIYSWLAGGFAVYLVFLELEKFWVTLGWLAIASTLLIAGFISGKKHLRLQGVILLGIVIVKVFLYDTRELETIYRTISFILLGILLLAASFFYTKYKEKLKDLL